VIVFSFLRSFFAGLFFIVFTFFWCVFAIIVAFLPHSKGFETWIMSTWGKVAIKIWGVKVVVKGLENIPKGSCLFVFNHTSFFDIFAMEAAYGEFHFGAKIELFQIPVFGAAMRRMGILPIARQRRESVFKVYEEAQKRAALGEKFALSPEGKRNERETLLPFKAGPFIFAINSKMPLVPVVIKGAHEILSKNQILPNWDRWTRTLTVEYLPPISTEGYSIEERTALQEKTYEAMKVHF
jgi:1-acyl-sn-glycerol-3-phosphate acyltransferase